MLIVEDKTTVETATGPMVLHTFTPAPPLGQDSRRYPGIAVFTEIYQVTGPVARTCRQLAGEGFIVCSPESYHEYCEPGQALEYNEEGTNRGNELKVTKPVEAFDTDARAALDWLKSQGCERLGAFGMCLGGHLAARCAMFSDVSASACFFATDIHKSSLGSNGDDSMKRLGDINGEILFIFGRQDSHVDKAGRDKIKAELDRCDTNYSWIEVNAQHAFIRDELSKGRYDPAITKCCMTFVMEMFQRRLVYGLGDTRGLKGKSAGPAKC
mmetsp:Transcript_4091/g.4737  ORF Transcript_4091/g.4737 Transcript_4091/m.4737 type:complete len:269 (-) Transcript_4091:1016-1822(-)|eukprot:CAMPEP_0204827746 /NCGR_PEP_ID=MMETSP1346-20131115/5200_1 /ASSEMBLY_ACC=CAM_ASM_000771 /TAXON_ID=215587 /ORGANISM="Aplanochytrium stocchinoi, Strain GSBS06" /LENGTH=268 /DNA_ID=CAMNT_0051956299 /DNA_START=45 /DNA_END=851 /DNA_ORIENTATION=+